MMVITPLTFLGGSFYSISMLPPFWQTFSLFNPIVYLISAFRWSFYGISDVNIVFSFGMMSLFAVLCLIVIGVIFKTGYRIKS
jgi:ABC-2 type transport system permease protein